MCTAGDGRPPVACSSLVDVADVGDGAILVHDAERTEPSFAFVLVHLAARLSARRR